MHNNDTVTTEQMRSVVDVLQEPERYGLLPKGAAAKCLLSAADQLDAAKETVQYLKDELARHVKIAQDAVWNIDEVKVERDAARKERDALTVSLKRVRDDVTGAQDQSTQEWISLRAERDQLRATLAEEQDEIRDFQDELRGCLTVELEDVGSSYHIDGGGCDSGSWIDFTMSELRQGVSHLVEAIKEQAEARATSAEKNITDEREARNACARAAAMNEARAVKAEQAPEHIRDRILYEHGPLKVNDVLGVIDDETPATPPAEVAKPREPTKTKTCPVCNGNGVDGHRIHGPNAEDVEPLRCEACDGFGWTAVANAVVAKPDEPRDNVTVSR